MKLRVLAVALGLALGACANNGPLPAGECDDTHACDGGVCVTGGRCAQSCSLQQVDAGCPEGQVCGATGPYCPPGTACPALAVQVCLWPDGGA